MVVEINAKKELLYYLDDFIIEITYHNGYQGMVYIVENPMIKLLSKITGFQPEYFGMTVNQGDYVMFDVEKIKKIREELVRKLPNSF